MLGFRVWDVQNKEFCGHREFVVSMEGDLLEHDGTNILTAWYSNKSFIPMQSTGLKDKNGKEIFCRDIIKAERKFSDSLSKPELFCVDDPFEIHASWELSVVDYSLGIESMEIIGNSFQNPELMEKL